MRSVVRVGAARSDRRRARLTAGLATMSVLAALNAGCYTAVPIAGSEARMGRRVAVDLTDAGAVEMARQVGPRARTLTGDVTALTEREMVLALRAVSDVRGIETFWGGEQVTVPRASIGTMAERRLSRGRTAVFSVGMLAGLYAIARGVGAIGGGSDHRGDLPVSQ